jgi:beta-ribofuranosylaminobenzene 5'-phosphate synthase
MNRCIRVRTPSRLHFGLSSLGHDTTKPQFGGVGMMVHTPCVELEITPANEFEVHGRHAERVAKFAESISEHFALPTLPEVSVQVIRSPRDHIGLGVGTQLGLATAAGLAEALGFPWRDPLRLAQLTRRGRRSAVGTYGFLMGGLIVDGGHLPGEGLGQLVYRGDVPADWRIALITAGGSVGRSGKCEDQAIANLPAVSTETTEKLEQISLEQLKPALECGDFRAFTEAVYEYGELAGECFAPAQGGTFCSKQTAELIEWLRAEGIAGVGQSSWGPTVFAFLSNDAAAQELQHNFAQKTYAGDFDFFVTAPANCGAVVTITD